MNHNIIIFAAIGAAVGGIIGSLLSNKVKGDGPRAAAMIVPLLFAAALGGVGGSMIQPNENGQTRGLLGLLEKLSARQTPFEKMTQKYAHLIVENPRFKEAIKDKSSAEIRAYAQEQTRLGIKRLPYDELKTWNSLRAALAEKDKTLCAMFWTGQGMTPEILVNAINQLPEESIDQWFKVSMTAASLELDQVEYPEPDSNAALGAGFKHILDSLEPTERTRYEKIMDAGGTGTGDDDACWAAQVLFKDTMAMNDDLQEAFLRSLAAL